ncbi:MAG: Nif3-like dinuclear metal center hexameric protein [Chitinophagaceae bacterium]|nr:Nif3-like dinuclear metal center hexameric protein [Chitinophagaceae bacterium]
MQIGNFIHTLEQWAPPSLQESYDNSGLLTGNLSLECKGILISLDATEEVINEARSRGCNLVIAHHPIIFKGLKKITGKTYVERAIIAAIKYDIAVYALHTNLDNIISGVNAAMAQKLGLTNCSILLSKPNQLKKLFTFAPQEHAETVRKALFAAGAGYIGNYSETSFNTPGTGTFKAGENATPFVGAVGQRHEEPEVKIEVIFPAWAQWGIVKALKEAHPYEEVAYDIVSIDNDLQSVGSGMMGELSEAVHETAFLHLLKEKFGLKLIRHTPLTGKMIQRVALCGGSGSFLTARALSAGADAYVTADVKYHEFFDAEGKMLLADIGHWESEQFTIDLIHDFLKEKFPTFAVLKTGVKTNPVEYFG